MLDTGIAILMRDDHVATVDKVTALPARPSISVVTKVELEGGVFAQPALSARRRLGLDALLRVLPVIEFTSDMADAYGQIVAAKGFNRRMIADHMIAATALVRHLTLMTTNGSDFAGIDGLKLEIWTP